ncbi:MAG: tRNA pseudouridine(55) synthase TruB [candidate division WOR-3 bacterium]
MTSLPCGVLNISKPAGPSSYDIIRQLKRQLHLPRCRIGHAGTLDPAAAGVLLILLQDATKLSHLLMAETKEYRAEILLGQATDTDDTTGRIVQTLPVPDLTEAAVRAALQAFIGTIEQVPPAFSAIKQQGRPLYRLARRGETVTARARTVTIHWLELVDLTLPRLTLLAEVSSGTYIRALARDLGRALGTCATLASLVRTRCGRFCLDESIAPAAVTPDSLAGLITGVADALPGLVRLELPLQSARGLQHGKAVPTPEPLPPAATALAMTSDRSFVALVTRTEEGRLACRRIICCHDKS